MTYLEEFKPATPTLLETILNWYLRLLAMCFVALTIYYWLRISGYYPGADWRFDTMSTPWKIASAILAVLLPVSAAGLWSTLSWGQVVWIMAIIIELLMYNWFTDYYGPNVPITTFHLATIAIYLGFRGLIALNENKK